MSSFLSAELPLLLTTAGPIAFFAFVNSRRRPTAHRLRKRAPATPASASASHLSSKPATEGAGVAANHQNGVVAHRELVIYVSPPGLGLPSFDPASLALITFLRLSKIEFSSRSCLVPASSPDGSIPYLRHGDSLVYGPAMAQYLAEHFPSSSPLSSADSSRLAAVSVLLQDLQRLQHFEASYPPENAAVTRPLLFSHLGWLLRHLLSPFHELLQRRPSWRSLELAYERAPRHYHALATLIGEGPFLLGEKFSFSDAQLVSHLCLVLYSPLRSSRLQHVLRASPGYGILRDYAERLSQKAFPTGFTLYSSDPLDLSAIRRRYQLARLLANGLHFGIHVYVIAGAAALFFVVRLRTSLPPPKVPSLLRAASVVLDLGTGHKDADTDEAAKALSEALDFGAK